MARMFRLYLLIIFLFSQIINFSFSQESVKVDSLIHALNQPNEDSTRVEILLQLFWQNRRSNPEKAIEYSEQALSIAQSIEFTQGIARSLQNCAIIRKVQGNYDSAFRLLNESKFTLKKYMIRLESYPV